MVFVSEIIGRIVTDVDGKRIGSLKDLIAVQPNEIHHPRITALVVKRGKDALTIPIADVVIMTAPAIPIKKSINHLSTYEPADHELWLIRDVLDKQIIDVNGIRVVRVNDLELTPINGDIYVSNVDIGGSGILRRLGMGSLVEKLETRRSGAARRAGYISWDDVELLAGDQPMRLKVPGEKLTDLHPADLAEIISDLTRSESSKILETLDVQTVADTLEEVEPEFQVSLIEQMPDERIADVLEEMAPDEAADLLSELPDERGEELLNLMEREEAADVRRLLAYPDDSAGGIMNTEYVAVRPDLTAEQVMQVLRQTAHEAETINYIYVTNKDGLLQGVFSLRQLVMVQPATPVTDFMVTRLITVGVLDQQDAVAQVVAKYNLIAVPVVDDHGKMHGIVTADDALDKIIPTAWKKRLPRLYH